MLSLLFRSWVLMLAAVVVAGAHPNHQLDLTYTHPGTDWVSDGLPLGNGYFGALVLGGVSEDRLRISAPAAADDEGAEGGLATLGELMVRTGHDPAAARTYLRRLDLQTAAVEISYRDGRVRHRREYFLSHPDRVLVARIRAVRSAALNLAFAWEGSKLAGEVDRVWDGENQRLRIRGGSGQEGQEGDGYEVWLEVRLPGDGGTVTEEKGEVRVWGADEVVFLLTVRGGNEPGAAPEKQLQRLKHDDAVTLYRRHLPDYQDLFHAMYLTLEGGAKTQLVTAKRRQLYLEKPAEDPGFEELLFQYGRYLLLTSSRAGTGIPAHPGGIWVWEENDGPASATPEVPSLAIARELLYAGAGPLQLAPCLAPWVAEGRGVPQDPAFYVPDWAPWENGDEGSLGQVAAFMRDAHEGRGDAAYGRLRALLQSDLTDTLVFPGGMAAANMALVRGMTDLFAREKDGVLHWAENLPSAWPEGSVVGLRTPGHESAYVWQEGTLLEGYLTALRAGEVRLASQKPLWLDRAEEAVLIEPVEEGWVRFDLAEEETVRVRAVEADE